MDEVQKMRQEELSHRNQRPPTPDFLKSVKSNPDRSDVAKHTESRSQPLGNPGAKPDFKNMGSGSFNQGFQGLANDIGGDLYSLDNIDKPLVDTEIVEDVASFEDRLKRLQSEREAVKPITQQKNVNFTDDNFPNSDIGSNNIPKHDPKEYDIKQAEIKQNELIRQAEEIKQNELMRQAKEAKRLELIKQATEAKRLELIKQAGEAKKLKLAEENKSNKSSSTSVDKLDHIRKSMKSVNIDTIDTIQQINQLTQLVDKLTNENNELKELIRNQDTKESSELDKIMDIKKQIAEEFEDLRIKNEEIDGKFSIFNLKELELLKKETEIKQLIENYDYLFRTRQMQVEISDQSNRSNYTWTMDPIPNVTGIKLMGYSLPEPKFNIEVNKNDYLHIKVNSNDIKLVIPTGKYTIDEVIYCLNDQLALSNPNIKLSLNTQQKVTIKSTNEEDKINIVSTQLSQYNLGFTDNHDTETTTLVANKIWDLRIEDKVYLYLTNLSEDVPFGILHFNGKSVSQFKFQKPFNINHLDVVFKDGKGNPYNFYDLTHNLSFIIEKID
jgi:hypothetical protein